MTDHYMFSGQGVDLSLPMGILITRAQLDQGSKPTFANNMVEFTELLNFYASVMVIMSLH